MPGKTKPVYRRARAHDGEDALPCACGARIQKCCADFPEVDARRSRQLVCAEIGFQHDYRLERKLRPLGVDVTDASDLSQPICHP